ncbi:MAG TPA: class I SAM-dependent methyltransferase [Gaiellaceae bacterium]|jgi:SAM-dependent methyltransferase|nr:class I SAM-dependent methyltransferase [Gaiellaceae bacterium]
MSEIERKYDAIAERYSEHDYADAERYYARRAKVVAGLVPAGATLLDIACGDGGLGRHLLARGIDYRGVDASERMVEVAQRTLGDRVVHGGFDYTPPESVDAATIFRSLYLTPDRRAFLAHLHTFTTQRLVFDFDPRAYATDELLADVRAAGWRDVKLRPFLMPQRASFPGVMQSALWAVEPLPGARLITKLRFPLVVSATA